MELRVMRVMLERQRHNPPAAAARQHRVYIARSSQACLRLIPLIVSQISFGVQFSRQSSRMECNTSD